MAFSMLKIRRPLGRLIFNMGIAIPGKTVFLIETAPWTYYSQYHCFWWGGTRASAAFIPWTQFTLICCMAMPALGGSITLVLWSKYLWRTRSISWLLMPWWHKEPWHLHPWYWLCRIIRYLFSMRKDFTLSTQRNYSKCKCQLFNAKET